MLNFHTDGGLVNFDNPDKDLEDEFKTSEEELLTLPDGRQVRQNDAEPFYGILSSVNEHYLAGPSGTLTIHVIDVKNFNEKIVKKLFPNKKFLNFYLRIDFLEKEFFSRLFVDVCLSDTRVILDHVLTFSIDEIAINENSETQNLIFNLIAVDETNPKRHIIVGKTEKPLLSFIRKMVASEILQLTRPAKMNEIDGGYQGERHMGAMLIKSAFAYGRFGYGHSNQIFDERMEPSDAIKYSIFPRYAVPSGRIQEAGKVLRFRPIRPLDIFPFEKLDALVGNSLLRIDHIEETEEEVVIQTAVPWMNPSLHYIPALTKEKFKEWSQKMDEMKGCTTRRVAFLKQTCTALPTREFSKAGSVASRSSITLRSPQLNSTTSGLLLKRVGSLPEVLKIQ